MPDSHSQYFFGNSLVNFAEGGGRANVPYWMDQFAESAGNTYAMNGSFGFLREFADRSEPNSQWGFPGVDVAWADGSEPFGAANFDTVLITPANFIQGTDPDANYPGDTRSPLDAVLDIASDISSQEPSARILIYEGWADMAPFINGFPPTNGQLQSYHAFNQGAYHEWYEDLTAQANAADPDLDITLLPVARILSELYATELSGIPVEALYVDDAPHGTDTTYYLASMIVYHASYGTPAPRLDPLPDGIHPLVDANHEQITAVIADELAATGVLEPVPDAPDPDPEPEPDEPDPDPEPPAPPNGDGPIGVKYFALTPEVTSLDDVDFSRAPDAEGRIDALALAENNDAPWPSGQADYFAALYTKEFTTETAGPYTFTLRADDAARLFLDGVQITDTESAAPDSALKVDVTLQAGAHEVEVQFLETEGAQSIDVNWFPANSPSVGEALVVALTSLDANEAAEFAQAQEKEAEAEDDIDLG